MRVKKEAQETAWSWLRYAGLLAGLTAVYFIGGKFGLSLAFDNKSATLVWPPAGIALAALLLKGYRLWPAVFAGAFLVNVTTAGSPAACLAIAAGNTLEALAAAYLINRYTGGGPRVFDRAQDILRFAVLAGVASTAIAATVGTTTLCVTGMATWASYGATWSTWWLGDMMGVFVMTPLLVLWAQPIPQRRNRYQFLETCFLLVFLLGTTLAVFGGFFSYVNYYPLSFICLPFVIWSVFRLSQREAVTAIFLISAIAIGATLNGLGPFARQSPAESLWILQVFLSAVTVIALTLITMVVERRRRESELGEKLEAIERLNAAMEHSNLELAKRQKITLGLLADLQESKANLEKQRQSLEAANRKLEQLSAVKDDFVSTVSHELRTPLAVIKEGVELVLDQILGELNDEQKDFLSTVNENIDRLTYLINNILDLSKIEAGRVSLVRRKTRVKPLVKTVVHNSRLMLARRTIDLESMADYEVFADPERTMQVLQNLFVNAIKFTPEDGVITFMTRQTDAKVEVSVKDNGIGIAEEDLPKMFMKFSQVGDAKNRPKGTGLGLALVKQLVELHKGQIWVRSEKGEGSVFTFTLPLYSGDLALEEHFRDETSHDDDRRVGVVVFDAKPFLRMRSDAAHDAEERAVDEVVDYLRRRLYASTPVFSYKPRWIVSVIPENKDDKDFQSFLGPLRETLNQLISSPTAAKAPPVFVNFGIAVHPVDGNDAKTLLAKAIEQAGAAAFNSS